jgi:hypothetical protein
MLLARIVMIAKQVMSDLMSNNPARNSVAMVPPSFSGNDLNTFAPSTSRAPAQDQRILPREN